MLDERLRPQRPGAVLRVAETDRRGAADMVRHDDAQPPSLHVRRDQKAPQVGEVGA